MAEFIPALKKVLAREGGYSIDPDDPGGETYKGIARRMHSKWCGWGQIDLCKRQSGFPENLDKDVGLQSEIEQFYQVNFWDKVCGDLYANQSVAESIFNFAVNAGVGVSASLAQMVADAHADGVIGNQSIAKINAVDPEHFHAAFTVAKIARYAAIVRKRSGCKKYFYGWVCRALECA